MREARKAAGIPQHELGRMLGVKQGMVSQIESGKIGASIYVPAICLALKIPLPQTVVLDAEDARWIALGRAVRDRSLRRFRRLLEHLEALELGTDDL
jgi:transcriptional regulator with XRE-family HTH domain